MNAKKKRYPHNDFRAGAHWKKFRVLRDAEGTGYTLYSEDEWNNLHTADHGADLTGHVTFQGRATGEVIPANVRRAAR